jgi:hypothetical protein
VLVVMVALRASGALFMAVATLLVPVVWPF